MKVENDIQFTPDNPANILKAMENHKNVLIRGIQGVGKITNTMKAVKDNPNVYYVGNPVDYEGKRRPGSYEKYQQYISSLKPDLTLVDNVSSLFSISSTITLIIDEIYGRSAEQMGQITQLLDMPNVKIIQIVGCMKYMGRLIEKMDIIIDLHHDTAFIVDKALAVAICNTLGRKDPGPLS
ncbi:MAG: hypothetical protein C0402_13105 [Thermodesulfovibrio sp.]|nr:hypothetical protein [Thermodesulfovibrio sp.]